MKKKLLAALLLTLLLAVSVSAHDFDDGTLYYTINGDGISVTVTGAVDGGLTGLAVPDHAEDRSTAHTVTAIGGVAFAHGGSLASVTFSEGSQLASISSGAFQGTALASVTIPASVIVSAEFAKLSATPKTGDSSQTPLYLLLAAAALLLAAVLIFTGKRKKR